LPGLPGGARRNRTADLSIVFKRSRS